MSSAGGTGNTEFPRALGMQQKNQWWIIIGMNGQWRKMHRILRMNKIRYLK